MKDQNWKSSYMHASSIVKRFSKLQSTPKIKLAYLVEAISLIERNSWGEKDGKEFTTESQNQNFACTLWTHFIEVQITTEENIWLQ